jgi:5-oxopent-3-ene-1,2,5-tricarboxylate decarboxylase / 2-hydroxyhepta-2,4-diene-1,7-dioate isomerase
VACAGVTIQPGDILVGDADGVVVLPPAIAAEVLGAAREQERQEQFIAERVAAGEGIDGLFPLPEARGPEYQAWLARQQPPQHQPEPPPEPAAAEGSDSGDAR